MVLFSRAPLPAPDLDALPEGCIDGLRGISDGLADLRPLPPEAVSGAPAGRFAALSHRLSPAFEQLNAPLGGKPRSPLESRALGRISAEEPGIAVSDLAAFKASLERLNALATAGAGRWRTGWAGLMPDAAGNEIRFPPAAAAARQLETIRKTMAGDRKAPALFDAALILCLFANCHPFTDGNGRVARILFNHALRRAGMPGDVDIPFYEIAARSRGGYVIALRHAEVGGDWQPIMRRVVEAILCHRALGQGR